MNLQGPTAQYLNPRRAFIEQLARTHPVPNEWARGPIPDRYRRVTDKLCLILFIAFLTLMAVSAIWAFSNSRANAFKKIYDSSGNVCGEGPAKDFPYLYMQNFSKPYRSVCVSKCPDFDYNQIKYGSSGKQPPLDFGKFTKSFAGNSYTYSNVLTEREAFEYPSFWANGYFSRDQWNDYLNSYQLSCYPNSQVRGCANGPDFAIYDSYSMVRPICVPRSPKAALLFNKVNSKFDLGNLEDLLVALPMLCFIALIALAISFLFLLIVYLAPKSAIWILFVLAELCLLAFAGMLLGGLYGNGYLNNPINPLRVKYLQFWLDNKPCILAIIVLTIIAAIVLAFFVIRYRNYLDISQYLINFAAKNIVMQGLVIAVVAFILLLQLAIFFFEVWVITRILTAGPEISDITSGSPFIFNQLKWWNYVLAGIHIFGTIWILSTLNHLAAYVISATATDYYFTSIIKPLHMLCHVLGHHLGTCAMGIFLFPVYLIKAISAPFDWLMTSENPNFVQNGFRAICSGCCWGYENFIDVVSQKYIPISYIGSLDFCKATRTYHALSEVYADQLKVIIRIGDILSICSRIIVTLIPCFIGYCLYKHCYRLQQNIDNLWLFWIAMAIISYFVGTLFVDLFTETYDAINVCHLVELDLRERGITVGTNPKIIQDAINDYRNRMSLYGGSAYRPMA